ncbi:MAG TPA: hypothetical protein VK217_09285 [Acidimicrobiales bacterium]|nr:hypothetical protein [Acidimicrobiales bacterium]
MSTATIGPTALPKRVSQRAAANAGAAGFLAMAVFQVALAFGAPLGHAAWGGTYSALPGRLRAGSAVSAAILILGALLILRTGGYPMLRIPLHASRWGTRLLSGGMALSALANFASASRWERFLMGPIALLLAMLCLAVARTASTSPDPTPTR